MFGTGDTHRKDVADKTRDVPVCEQARLTTRHLLMAQGFKRPEPRRQARQAGQYHAGVIRGVLATLHQRITGRRRSLEGSCHDPCITTPEN
ncbi:hypothetical protein [Variovorax saccharolyticus]|uniref:hypothetical protein n=1 Tax=Variovorax saccharolyticus TaxID=3053516 RepID=UPI002575C827|nr:hypothetical protein [Variovorax sp. J31P216]MDM0029929.1 hypothetical protein [Variovorax sp. J31P216]